MDLLYACAREEAQRIRSEEGHALFSIQYFANVREVRFLVITDRVLRRTFEFTPKARLGPSLKVIRANLQEWDSKRLELVPSEWRIEPAILLETELDGSYRSETGSTRAEVEPTEGRAQGRGVRV